MKIYGATLRLMLRVRFSEQLYLLADQALWSGSSFIIGVLVARLLSPEELTHYSVILACLFFITSGQQSLIFSFIYSRSYSLSTLRLSRAINMQYIIVVVLLAIFAIASTLILIYNIVPVTSLIILFSFIMSLMIYEYYRKIYIYTRKYQLLLGSDIIVRFVPLLLLLILRPAKLNELLITLAASATLYIIFMNKSWSMNWKKDLRFCRVGRNVKCMFDFGKWLLLGNVLQWTSGYLVLFGATFIIGAREVGYVIAIKNLLGVATLVFQFYENYVTPRFERRFKIYEDSIQLVKLSILSFFILVAFLITVYNFGESLVLIILGSKYVEYSNYAYPLLLMIAIEFLQRPLLVLLRAYDQTKVVFYAYAVSTCIAVVLVFPIVSRFGGLGMIGLLIVLQVVLIGFYACQLRVLYRQRMNK